MSDILMVKLHKPKVTAVAFGGTVQMRMMLSTTESTSAASASWGLNPGQIHQLIAIGFSS